MVTKWGESEGQLEFSGHHRDEAPVPAGVAKLESCVADTAGGHPPPDVGGHRDEVDTGQRPREGLAMTNQSPVPPESRTRPGPVGSGDQRAAPVPLLKLWNELLSPTIESRSVLVFRHPCLSAASSGQPSTQLDAVDFMTVPKAT